MSRRGVGAELIGFEERPASLAEMRADPAPHFVKTHRQRDEDVDDSDRVILLVRDGRDALVSWARQSSEDDGSLFESSLRTMIDRTKERGTGSWGANVLGWLEHPEEHRVVLHYEELIADPVGRVSEIVAEFAPELRPLDDATIPSFAELHAIDDRFFRRGVTGSHRDELPESMTQRFWARADNATAMEVLGFPKLRIREAVRALVIDGADRVLLVRFEFPTRTVWAAPGGGVDPGESDHDALRRELVEEIGLRDPVIGPHLWNRLHVFPFVNGQYDGQRERVHLVRVPTGFEPRPQFTTEQLEAEFLFGMQWWTLADLQSASADGSITTAPASLAALVEDLLRNGPPTVPADVEP